jgi:Uma2 family endonuclease
MPDDGFRYELVKGELKKMSPSGYNHGRIAINATTPLDGHVRANDLGVVCAAETGFILSSDPDTVLAPDVAFVSRRRIEEVGEVEGYWPGAPDMVVEVISSSDTYTEVEEKVIQWLSAGVRMVLVVDPRKRTVTVYRSLTDITILTEGETIDGGDVVPGWKMPVDDLFA